MVKLLIEISRLREQFRDRGYVDRIATNDDLALKQCFQNAVAHYTRSQQAQQQLEEVFQDWHPALMPKSIKVLVSLISRVLTAWNTLFTYVREALGSPLPSLTTLHLAEHLMLIDEYRGDFKPRSLGELDTLENLALACQRCNSYRYNFTEGTDPESQVSITLFNPRLNQWNEHFIWKKGGLMIRGKTSIGRATCGGFA